MTVSATTISRHKDAGVTLVEVLVILAILSVVTGMAALALPSGPRPATLRQQADLLAARLDIAAEESLVSGRAARLEWDTGGYRFTAREGGEWAPHRNPNLAGPHRLEGMALRRATGGQTGALILRPDLGPPDGAVAALDLRAVEARNNYRVTVLFDGASARVDAR
ncbi:hypothetical protein ATO6_10160 [Oceanicola sp. 22II-s10i]|uniref:prepilin-type N-terminal cleavage/methylation domain-containing protein n=1 Tax=Oceanicola sp. 22II-s10i TaxID=1317116 RepID=UPI000B51ED5A|nr:prepilin-type N-terminal cleavage/methylation domain-containing protein [Oceanicola sp. 22II-s10i]OWU84704.1 hypothetical protein ATO6_10160 [Oceanicola sp. 22II-s10i]